MADMTDEQRRVLREQIRIGNEIDRRRVRAKAFDDAGDMVAKAGGRVFAAQLYGEAENIRNQLALDLQGDDL